MVGCYLTNNFFTYEFIHYCEVPATVPGRFLPAPKRHLSTPERKDRKVDTRHATLNFLPKVLSDVEGVLGVAETLPRPVVTTSWVH